MTITYDHAARRRSYELIADEFGLAGDDSGAASEGSKPGQAVTGVLG